VSGAGVCGCAGPERGRRRNRERKRERQDVLGNQSYESLARKGETMTTAAMATYAYDQIDQARAELNTVSKQTTFESLKTLCWKHRERQRPVVERPTAYP
jgi:hypothetical protein